MSERFSWKKVSGAALAVFIVFLMVAMGFVAAVETNTNSEPTNGSGADEYPDSPGQEGIQISGSDPSVLEIPQIDNDLDRVSEDYYEPGSMNVPDTSGESILRNSYNGDLIGEPEESESESHFNEIGMENNVVSYRGILSDVVSSYISSVKVAGAESHDHDGADISSNLFTTVSEYMNDDTDGSEPDLSSVFDELSMEGLTPENEVTEKRDEFSKSYRNDDGTITAAIFENPIHYEDTEGNWQLIDTNLEIGADGGYDNYKNTIRSSFDFDSSEVVVDLGGTDSQVKWVPVSMSYTDVYGLSHSISEPQSTKASVSGNTISYEGTFAATDEKYTIYGGQIKHNLILNEMPSQATNGLYLSYIGILELAEGLALYVDGAPVTGTIETQSDIEIRNADGETLLYLPAPIIFESDNEEEAISGSYGISVEGKLVILSINTPVEWLKDPAREYPVIIDPFYVTRNVYRYRNGYLYEYKYVYNNPLIPTRYIYGRSTSTHPYIGYRYYRYSSYTLYYTYRDYIRFNTASIPDGKTIVDMDLATYYHGSGIRWGGYVREMTTRPDVSPYNFQASFKAFDTARFYYTSYDVDPTGQYKTGKTQTFNSYTTFDNLNKLARDNLKANLPSNYFYVGLMRASEAGSIGYGWLHPATSSQTYLRVTYDDCPRTPIARLDGPYSVPEGTKTLRLDASNSAFCGSPTFLFDIGNDGITDHVVTNPLTPWWDWTPSVTDTYNFIDEITGTIQIKMTLMDVTSSGALSSTYYTYYNVYNVAPRILGAVQQIVGDEGTTITLKPVKFSDPGIKDSFTYWYDLNGNNLVDDGPGSTGTIAAGEPQIVPAVSKYFCDGDGRPQYINLTVEDNDGGFSDDVETQYLYASYDGDLEHIYRPADYPYYYGRSLTYSSYYQYMPVRFYPSTSYVQEYRSIMKFDTRNVPSGVTVTDVELRTYLDYVRYGGTSIDYGGKLGVNSLETDPSLAYTYDPITSRTLYNDADSSNILASGNYVNLKYTDQNKYHTWKLKVSDFTSKRASHSAWYGVGFDRYDNTDSDFYMDFDGGSRTRLKISYQYSWSTSTFTTYAYPYGGSSSNQYGLSGYAYFNDYWGRYLYTTTSSFSSSAIYLQVNEQGTGTWYNQLPLMKFDTGGIPSTFTPTKVTLRSYLDYVSSSSLGGGGKVTVNDVSVDPHTTVGGEVAGRKAVYNDAQSGNVMLGSTKYKEFTTSSQDQYYNFDLDPADFIQEHAAHPKYYALAFDRFDETDDYLYMYFRMGGTYTTLTLDDGTTKYELRLYTYTDPTSYRQTGYRGYTRHQWLEPMDDLFRDDDDYYAYHRDKSYSSYATVTSKSFFKFGTPAAHPSKILSLTGQVRMYTAYSSGYNLYTGMTKNLIDPETATDQDLFDAIKDSSPQIYTYTSYTYVTLPYTSAEYTSIFSSNDWFAFGFKQNSGRSPYGRTYAEEYPTTSYKPQLIVTHRVPWQLPVYVRNVDPVISGTPILSKSVVDEGETVRVSGLTYSDQGTCDTHEVRVVTYAGSDVNIAKDWTPVSGGTLDFDFEAPDDDPEDGDSDITQDTVRITIEVRDDNYEDTLKWDTVEMDLYHYYYYYGYLQWYQPWGVYEQLTPWQEITDDPLLGKKATWNNFPKSTAKSTPESTVTDHYPYPPHFDTWDVTALAKKWITNPGSNNGVRVMPTLGTWSRSEFYSSDHSSSVYRPKLTFTATNPAISPITIQPNAYDGKDAMLRYSPSSEPYGDTNYGTYIYLTQTQDYSPLPYLKYETNALIEFDLSDLPIEHEEWGKDGVSTLLTIKNVKPGLDSSGVKIIVDDKEVSSINEGDAFRLTNISVADPAAGQPTEVFEYRYKIDDGSFSTWETIGGGGTGGVIGATVVPNGYENQMGTATNVFPWGSTSARRYQQWYSKNHLPGGGMISEIGFRNMYTNFDATYNNLKIYMSHKSSTGLSTTFASNYGTERTLVLDDSAYNYARAIGGDTGFAMIELEKPFPYNGKDNIVVEIVYDSYSGRTSGMNNVHVAGAHARIWANSPTATSGSTDGIQDYGMITKFVFSAALKGEVLLPDIELLIPDDHPETGTPSDDFLITVELKDDDMVPGDKAVATTTFTVHNVAPEIVEGTFLVDGVEYNVGGAGYLETMFAQNNGQSGNMFDVTAKKTLTITSFDINVRSSSTFSAEVYYRKGGYAGFERNPSAWTKLGTASITGMGTNNPTPLPIGGLKIYKSETFGLYVTLVSSTSIGYTNGLRTFQNDELSLTSGVGKSYPFGSTFYPRTWNGRVHYDAGPDYLEIDEGQFLELQDWGFTDPAKGESTETFEYQVEWGDGQFGERTAVEDVINPPTKSFAVSPPSHENNVNTYTGGIPPLASQYLATYGWIFGGSGVRWQQLVPSSDLGSAKRTITGLSMKSWEATSPPWTANYNNFKIYMNHFSGSSLSTSYSSNYGSDRTLVMSRSTYSISHDGSWGWVPDITFDTAFDWDGSSNLVFEIQFSSGSGTSFYAGVMQIAYFSSTPGWGADSLNAYSNNPGSVTTGSKYGWAPPVKMVFKPIASTSGEQPYRHLYRDDPAVGDFYTLTVHLWDDDTGEGTFDIQVKVNNIKPAIDVRDQALGLIKGKESTSASLILPSVNFHDNGSQYDVSNPNEIWTYWWDLDGNGLMNNAPDVVGTVPQSLMDQSTGQSEGQVPSVTAAVPDDFIDQPLALYLFDDDMTHALSSAPSSATGTMTVDNVAPVAAIEVFVPMEVRVRMSGRMENDVKVEIIQKDARGQTAVYDAMTIERMPGQPKDNPFADGTPSAPLFVKADPANTVNLVVTFDANADPNDVQNPDDPTGSDPVWIYLDFPLESDYDPREDDQSSTGHHWAQSFKFNSQKGATQQETVDVTSALDDRWAWLIGHSTDDASDDAAFYWTDNSGTSPLSSSSNIVYYNDGTTSLFTTPPGPTYKDGYPTPWTGTAPCHYEDIHLFKFSAGFSVSLYTVDDDDGRNGVSGKSNVATYSVA
jgi:hypothetical protein